MFTRSGRRKSHGPDARENNGRFRKRKHINTEAENHCPFIDESKVCCERFIAEKRLCAVSATVRQNKVVPTFDLVYKVKEKAAFVR